MAEVAGLVIGGVSLVALFDQCMSIFDYVDSGLHCGENYQNAALMLTLLGGRLGRWERTCIAADTSTATEEDGEKIELGLKQIHKRLQEAEKMGERYAIGEASTDKPSAETAHSKAISSLVTKLQRKLIKKTDGLSFAKRARWALRDENEMEKLVVKLDRLIGSLEKLELFKGQHERRVEVATADAAAIVQTSKDEGYAEALETLKAAAQRVDQDFDVAATTTSNVYRNITIDGNARVKNGNYYSEGWAKAGGQIGKGGGYLYDGIRIGGDARVQNGVMFGGRSVFDD